MVFGVSARIGFEIFLTLWPWYNTNGGCLWIACRAYDGIRNLMANISMIAAAPATKVFRQRKKKGTVHCGELNPRTSYNIQYNANCRKVPAVLGRAVLPAMTISAPRQCMA
jgi:hypothetical protein